MAFQGAFDKVFEISEQAGYHMGGNLVDDAFELLENLVCKNETNQVIPDFSPNLLHIYC